MSHPVSTSALIAILACSAVLPAACGDESSPFKPAGGDSDTDTDTDSDSDTDTDTDTDTDSDTDTDTDTDSDSDTGSESEICDDDIDNDLDDSDDCDDTDCFGDTDACPCPPNVCQDFLDYVVSLFGYGCGDPEYDPIADIDKNMDINMIDISMATDCCGDPEACEAAWENTSDPC